MVEVVGDDNPLGPLRDELVLIVVHAWPTLGFDCAFGRVLGGFSAVKTSVEKWVFSSLYVM